MNPTDDPYRDLQEQLDEAGKLFRPRHPGWETLLDRLPAQEPPEPAGTSEPRPKRVSPPRSGRWGPLAVAATVLLAVTLGVLLWPGPQTQVRAQTLPIQVIRRGVEVTIFSASEHHGPTLYMAGLDNPIRYSPGMALVKDRRMILHLQKGDNLVKFTDVAATIDPTSVRLVSDTDPTGTKVVEQNFEYDLANADALLKRSLEEKITCIGKDGGELQEGFLLAYDDQSIVLGDTKPSDDPNAPRPKTQTIARGRLQAIRLDHKPSDLYTRPTLVWKLRTDKPGDHLTTLTYLCGDVVWRADYVALVRESGPDGDVLDLKAWVTIDNRSGTAYPDAGLKLIAGDVNRVRDPWAPVPPQLRDNDLDVRVLLGAMRARLEPKEFREKDFFEYKLYALNQPSTIKNRQIKQLALFKAEGVKARRRYVCRSHPTNLYCTIDAGQAEVQWLVKNEKQNHLGRPLPKGMVTLMALDVDGDSQFVGRDDIDHTAKDEELEIAVGRAFDVVYDYRITGTWHASEHRMVQTYEYRIRNHKPHDIAVRVIGRLMDKKNWDVVASTDEVTRHDHNTVHVDVSVPANTEKTVSYTIDYRW